MTREQPISNKKTKNQQTNNNNKQTTTINQWNKHDYIEIPLWFWFATLRRTRFRTTDQSNQTKKINNLKKPSCLWLCASEIATFDPCIMKPTHHLISMNNEVWVSMHTSTCTQPSHHFTSLVFWFIAPCVLMCAERQGTLNASNMYLDDDEDIDDEGEREWRLCSRRCDLCDDDWYMWSWDDV